MRKVCLILSILLFLQFPLLAQQSVKTWKLTDISKESTNGIHLLKTQKEALQDSQKKTDENSPNRQKKGNVLKIAPPDDDLLQSEQTLILDQSIKGLVLSIDKYYQICRSATCQGGTYIEIFGINEKGLSVTPQFILNAGNEKWLKVNQNRLTIHKTLSDDILVYFEETVSKIQIINGRTSSDIHPFVEINTLGVVNQNQLQVKNMDDFNWCKTERLSFFLDASASMSTSDKTAAVEVLTEAIANLQAVKSNVLVDVVVFAANGKVLVESQPVGTENDLIRLEEQLLKEYVNNSSASKAWTNWQSGLDQISNNENSLQILLTDGISNGSETTRNLLINSQSASANENLMIVGVEAFNSLPLFNTYSKDLFLQFLPQISTCNFKKGDLERDTQITVLPNPFQEFVKVRFGSVESENYKLQLFDAQGQVVKEFEVAAYQQELQIPTSELHTGMYILRASGDTLGDVATFSLVKTN